MAYRDMVQELLGYIPGANVALVKTKINEALSMIYDEQLWSFQLLSGGWLAPGVVTHAGAITATMYSNQVTFDAAASAAILALQGQPLITQLQVRVVPYTLYNILSLNATVPTAVTFTLDRPWMEPNQTTSPYLLYQAYFPAPAGFKKWVTIKDVITNIGINYWTKLQSDLDVEDPARTDFGTPEYVVPFGVDTRLNSATFGQMLYELWPHQLSPWPYSFSCVCKGPPLVLPTDAVPYPLTDEMVKWRAQEVLYLWKEAQKGETMERGSGADFKFLAQEAHAQYVMRLKNAKILDQNLVDMYFTRFRRYVIWGQPYATITGQLNIGGW